MFLMNLMFSFMLVQLNCENLFDCQHDSLKDDYAWLPDGRQHWTTSRYWRKINLLAQEIIACGGEDSAWTMPDMVCLCEVENDSVVRDLCRRSPLRGCRYDYFVTQSPDARGIDVALLYSPFAFSPISHRSIRVTPLEGMKATRDILYVSGRTTWTDTLHVFVVHAPSKSSGERATASHRIHVAQILCDQMDSIRRQQPDAQIIIAGDLNEDEHGKSIQMLVENGLTDVARQARGRNGARASYRFRGDWSHIDHVLVSSPLASLVEETYIFDAPFLLEEDRTYGGVKPRRTYLGPAYHGGASDHLPVVVRFGRE